MACPELKQLELLAAGTLDKPLTDRLRRHSGHCRRCAVILKNQRELLAEIQNVSEVEMEALIQRLLHRIKPHQKIDILPLFPLRNTTIRTDAYVLAAQTDRGSGYTIVQTYANPDEDILLRILRSTRNGELTAFLLTPSMDKFREGSIEIETSQDRWPIDSEGMATLTGLTEKGILGKTFFIRTPLAVFDLSPLIDFKEKLILQGRFQVTSPCLDRIQIDIEDNGGKKRYRIQLEKINGMRQDRDLEVTVFQKGLPSITQKVHQGVAIFEELDPGRMLKIHIY